MLSKWGCEMSASGVGKRTKLEVNVKGHKEYGKEMHMKLVNEVWRVLHDGHVGMKTIKYHNLVCGISAELNISKENS